MTKDETRMTNQAPMTQARMINGLLCLLLGFDSSFVIRHSSFDFRH